MDIHASSESTAGNFHISSKKSVKRVRPPAPPLPNKNNGHIPPWQPHERSLLDFINRIMFPGLVLPIHNRHLRPRPWFKLCFKWMLTVYCFLSIVVFSMDLYSHTRTGTDRNLANIPNNASAFDGVSAQQRLSKMFSLHHGSFSVDPFIIRSTEAFPRASVTACLWTYELYDFGVLRTWAVHWNGPISLVMITEAGPDTSSHFTLLRRLSSLKTAPVAGLSVHLLHGATPGGTSGNAYLNVARYFAPTPVVILFPGNISEPPTFSHETIAVRALAFKQRPLIVTTKAQNSTTFSAVPPLSPAVIQRNHQVWCTERFFMRASRTSDWRACLWQIWLDSFGDIANVNFDIGSANRPLLTPQVVSNDRLSIRFRTEVCDLAARSMATLGVKKDREGRKKVQWTRETCGQFTVDKILKNARSE